MIQIKGLEALDARFKSALKRQKNEVIRIRNAVVADLLAELAKNIPVWSGRTLSSIRVSGRGVYAALQGEPSPEEQATFGATNSMAMGSEPMRAVAMSLAKEELANLTGIKGPAYLTIHSEAWGLVENAKAPTSDNARNSAVVSAIALAVVRSKYSGAIQ